MLGNDYAQARKQYVEEVRQSFKHVQPEEYEEDPGAGTASFFKVRFLIAVCIFAACFVTGRGAAFIIIRQKRLYLCWKKNSSSHSLIRSGKHGIRLRKKKTDRRRKNE